MAVWDGATKQSPDKGKQCRKSEIIAASALLSELCVLIFLLANSAKKSRRTQSISANTSATMKKIFLSFAILLSTSSAFSQDLAKFTLYKPTDRAELEIDKATKEARKEKKHVLIQIGGNWCIWCARFHEFITSDAKIDSIVKADYVVYHLNYSKENFNSTLLAKYGYPQRFGFPVFLVLDATGKLIETQNSWYLEDGKKSYDRDKVIEFLTDWSLTALDPKQYKEQ